MLYDPVMVQPMRDEMKELGFVELTTANDVHQHLKGLKGTALVFVNSVCGCAAGGARPALRIALQTSDKKPDKLLTVFAGQDRDATNAARGYFVGVPPSSPAMALIKDGDVVHMIERHHIEGNMPDTIAKSLRAAFAQYC